MMSYRGPNTCGESLSLWCNRVNEKPGNQDVQAMIRLPARQERRKEGRKDSNGFNHEASFWK